MVSKNHCNYTAEDNMLTFSTSSCVFLQNARQMSKSYLNVFFHKLTFLFPENRRVHSDLLIAYKNVSKIVSAMRPAGFLCFLILVSFHFSSVTPPMRSDPAASGCVRQSSCCEPSWHSPAPGGISPSCSCASSSACHCTTSSRSTLLRAAGWTGR